MGSTEKPYGNEEPCPLTRVDKFLKVLNTSKRHLRMHNEIVPCHGIWQ